MADIFSVVGIGAEYITMKIKAGTDIKEGDAVVLTGNNEVGFPTTSTIGDLFGIVSVVDGASGYSTVQYKGFASGVACDTTANPTLGKLVAVTDKGKLTVETELVGNRGICTSIDATSDVADILM